MIKMQDLTPKRMVAIFDRYVHGQQDAKAILAVAIRNRWRLCRLDHDARLAVVKQNILLHGPTGSGKSTLIKLLDGEEVPTKGSVKAVGIDVGKLKRKQVPVYRRNIGVIFQDFRLLPEKTEQQNTNMR